MRLALFFAAAVTVTAPGSAVQEKKQTPQEQAQALALEFAKAVNGEKYDDAAKMLVYPAHTQILTKDGNLRHQQIASADAFKKLIKADVDKERLKLGATKAEVGDWKAPPTAYPPVVVQAAGKTGFELRVSGSDEAETSFQVVVVFRAGKPKILYACWKRPLA